MAPVLQYEGPDLKCAESSGRCSECTKCFMWFDFYSLFLPWLKTGNEMSVLGLRLNAQQ